MRSDEGAGIAYNLDGNAPEGRSPTAGASLSGLERDHLFLNANGERFIEVSGMSGLDHLSDGRGFVIFDYDRDGRPDVAVVSANSPLLALYRNRIGEGADSPAPRRGSFAVRFVGGNRSGQASDSWSARDGYGARLSLELGDVPIVREHRAGEGLASQNSATMLVGIGAHEGAERVSVRWPSGRVQDIGTVEAGSLITVFENAADSPSGTGIETEPYARSTPSLPVQSTRYDRGPDWPRFERAAGGPGLAMFSTFATWCQECVEELPQLQHLRAAFSEGEFKMWGVPYDESESPELRDSWIDRYDPPYEAFSEADSDTVAAVQAYVKARFKIEGIPATIVTGPDDRVLLAKWGPPTVSEIRKLLESID